LDLKNHACFVYLLTIGSGIRIQGFEAGFRHQDSGIRIQGFRIQGFETGFKNLRQDSRIQAGFIKSGLRISRQIRIPRIFRVQIAPIFIGAF